ncbi:hypothetical protein M2272_000080 [Mycobacterium frederiksbergense]|uniref:DUF3239 domain-containing protein n=1 Tax=Mycolicibacterium frederiksbergense TaxID=117567 RepID=A0ABT6KS52_9MYCO|nr:hypothetical protein [Mycolicibacterium frederiksbergense]MDH6193459.1 hypothetical protein [Mycolicibacterium frederiksbergense]
MSRPAPQVPIERRRPIPPFSSLDEVKRVAQYPHTIRVMVTMMAIAAVYFLGVTVYAFATRDHQNMVVVTVLVAVYLASFVGATKFALPSLMRRFYDRVMRGGVLCDVYPAGFPNAKTAILVDTRLSDAQAAFVHDATATWLGRLASDSAARAQLGDLFADGPIRSAEELVGPGGRGGFLVARDTDLNNGWRLVLPEANPRDPYRPYSKGVVVHINTPSPESTGK